MTPETRALGTRIREQRLKRGWSQDQFADNCGIHRSRMGEIERGEVDLTLSTMLLIARTFESTLAALFKGVA